jgi:two-component system chemotaxis response regulator CheY
MTMLPPTVLVVEASETVREVLVRQLGDRGYRVVAAADGDAALALVAAERPDAILLDHELPGLSGAEILDRLRADDELAAVPVIMLTHSADREVLLDALQRGAHDHLVAPFDPAELAARVKAALRVKGLHDQLVEANQRLAAQALTDELTGLANRRHGAHELERAVSLATRHGHLLALARVDVDHFKQINDTYGHQAGDRVLAEVARRLAGAVRGGDELARWGGDEFVAILPDTDREGGLRAAERLRAAVAATPVPVDGVEVDVTISVGWAHWAGDTPDDLLARADRALYQAKDVGRDTVRPER